MTTSCKTSAPLVVKGTTSCLSAIKSMDMEGFLATSTAKELNAKFDELIREFGVSNDKESKSLQKLTKSQRGFSLSQILAQSLQNGDRQMLEAALCVSSSQHTQVLQISLQRLPVPMVVPLLEALVQRITLKPRRATHLLPWLKTLLLCHAGYLTTVPAVSKLLSPLQQSIEERLVALASLQKLSGRLDLIISQAKFRESTLAMIESSEMLEEPLAVYDESEESEIEEDESMDDAIGVSEESDLENEEDASTEESAEDEEDDEDDEEDDEDGFEEEE